MSDRCKSTASGAKGPGRFLEIIVTRMGGICKGLGRFTEYMSKRHRFIAKIYLTFRGLLRENIQSIVIMGVL